ncbi:gustatory receptor for sugar taste 43a-like [Diabrotica undecimpunctata]|uniref:gustatory receptor for sugar taste 43a-like n=1 Tax=Diabrotica undecimpunctata TaxID=50387 RepID=UPI003B6342E6
MVSIIFIFSVIFTYICVYILDIYTWNTNFDAIDGFFILFIDYVPYYILKIIMLNQILFFCHMIYFIKLRLAILNTYVMKITTQKIFGISIIQNGEIKVLPPNCTNNEKLNDVAKRVLQLTNVYRTLYETVDIISTTGGFGIGIVMFFLMVHLITTPYFVFSELAKGSNENVEFLALQVLWTVAHSGKFFVIMETCNQCVSEAEETLKVIQKLLVQETLSKIKRALLIFLITCTNCRVEVNINALFKIERSILTGFVAAITTYLVVLLQFQ